MSRSSRSHRASVVPSLQNPRVQTSPPPDEVLTIGGHTLVIRADEPSIAIATRIAKVLSRVGEDKVAFSVRRALSGKKRMNAAYVIRTLMCIMGRVHLRHIMTFPDHDPHAASAQGVM